MRRGSIITNFFFSFVTNFEFFSEKRKEKEKKLISFAIPCSISPRSGQMNLSSQ